MEATKDYFVLLHMRICAETFLMCLAVYARGARDYPQFGSVNGTQEQAGYAEGQEGFLQRARDCCGGIESGQRIRRW